MAAVENLLKPCGEGRLTSAAWAVQDAVILRQRRNDAQKEVRREEIDWRCGALVLGAPFE